jgi:iron complex outermembrane recepter protein
VRSVFCLAALLSLPLVPLVAQQQTPIPVIEIRVQDQSGAAIPLATLVVHRIDGKLEERKFNAQGLARVSVAVPISFIDVEAEGFSRGRIALVHAGVITLTLKPASSAATVAVTGSRTAVELEQSPIAQSVVTREQIEARNITLPDTALQYEVGVNNFRSKGAEDSNAGVGMRGFSGRSQARVLVLLDGQPMNDAYNGSVNWGAIPATEIDRVEVARGPSSTLYGGNAMGGVIQLFTRPVRQRTFEISSQKGSNRTTLYSGRYSDRFFNRLGVTFSYQRMQTGGYSVLGLYTTASNATAVSGGPLVSAPQRLLTTTNTVRYQIGNQGDNWYDQDAYRVKIEYVFTDRTLVNFQYIRPKYNYGYYASVPSVFDADGNAITSGSFFFYDNGVLKKATITSSLFVAGPGGTAEDLFTGSLLHTFSPASMLRISGGSNDNRDSWYSLPSSSATFTGGAGTSSESPNRSSHADALYTWDRFRNHHILVGTEFRQDGADTASYILSNFYNRSSVTQLTKRAGGQDLMSAAYAQDEYTLHPRIQLVYGGRYDNWHTYDGYSQSAPTASVTGYPSRSEGALSGKIAALWRSPGGLIVRASTGNAFRAPTLLNLYQTSSYPAGTITLANPDLKPEHMKSWELGVRKQIFSWFNLDATYFENWVHDLIYTTTDYAVDSTGSTKINLNAGRSRTRGIELGFEQRATGWLKITESYTLNNARIVENASIPASVGKYIPYVPRNTASVLLLAEHKQWSGTLGAHYMSRTFNSDTNTDIVKGVAGAWDPYAAVDVSASYRLRKRVSVFVSASNLLDRTYYEYYLAPGRLVQGGVRFSWQKGE